MKIQNSLFIKRMETNKVCSQQERKEEHTQSGKSNEESNMDFILEEKKCKRQGPS